MNLSQLLGDWAQKYDVRTVLERMVGDGVEPACASLVAQGKTIEVVVDDAGAISRAQAAYGPSTASHLAGRREAELPKSDLVVVHGTAPHGDWRAELRTLGKLASKLIVVAVENKGAWRAELRSRITELTGAANGDAGWGRTDALAPVLWEIGRVREHTFLDVPPLGERPPRFLRKVAPLHAFVVDVTPRSPQARRRLRLDTA